MTLETVFEDFFFSSGITGLLALTFMLMIVIGMLAAWKYSGMLLSIPLAYLLIEYLNRLDNDGNYKFHLIYISVMLIICWLPIIRSRE